MVTCTDCFYNLDGSIDNKMWANRIILHNIRSFAGENQLTLAKNINIFVGQNNSGKSTILKSIYSIQNVSSIVDNDITLGGDNGRIGIHLNNIRDDDRINGSNNPSHNIYNKSLSKSVNTPPAIRIQENSGNSIRFKAYPNTEPLNAIYPYFSMRKTREYIESVNLGTTNSVTGSLQNLPAKISRLCNVSHPESEAYQNACKDVLGFLVSTVASEQGQSVAYIVSSFLHIPLTSMGEGVANLLGLIVDLCIAENKIFLIEELENDIHPQALKALLQLIEKKSDTNQFFISTHSNIVTKYLGSVENSKVFKVSMSLDTTSRLPVSQVEEVENEPTVRLKLLEELGYEPFDFSQWKAWLILEESSAEVIIRDYLIPYFVPELKNKLRTYSAGSLDEVEPKFRDFNNLFVFVHLEQVYKNKAWVIVDDGENEKQIIDKMREIYGKTDWNETQFLQFKEHDFEKYYPERFQEEVTQILEIENKNTKRERKRVLIENVKQWANENPNEAKTELVESAVEVIEILKGIAEQIR